MWIGGAAPSGSGILRKVQELQKIKGKLHEAQDRLVKLEEEMRKSEREREAWKRMMGELELKEHEKQGVRVETLQGEEYIPAALREIPVLL